MPAATKARSAGRRRCGRIGLKPMGPASQPAARFVSGWDPTV